MFIKYNDSDCDFLEKNASVIRGVMNGCDEWYFFPFILRKVANGVFEEVSFRKAPQQVKDMVQRIESSDPYIEIKIKD